MEIVDNNEWYAKYHEFVRRKAMWAEREFGWGLDPGEAEQIAWIATLECYKRYAEGKEGEKKAKFETYANYRIRGAIIDEVRKRTAKRNCDKDGNRTVTNKQMDSLDAMELSEYERLTSYSVDMEKLLQPSFEELIKPIKDEKYKNILRLMYIHELTLKEVASIYGLTESRISQIHIEATKKLRLRRQMYGTLN